MTPEKPYVSSIDVGMLKGELNGVTIQVQTDLGDSSHTLRYGLSSTARDPEIERHEHKHPWSDRVKSDPERYVEDAKAARETAREELRKRNLDNVAEWHESDI